MTTPYSITSTAPTVYLDRKGQAVQGFLITVHLEAYDELHEIRVASLAEKTVKAAADELVNQRDNLAALGSNTAKK